MTEIRKWTTARYNGSVWFRLAAILVLVAVNLFTTALLVGFSHWLESQWLGTILVIVSMVSLAFFFTWLVTWSEPWHF